MAPGSDGEGSSARRFAGSLPPIGATGDRILAGLEAELRGTSKHARLRAVALDGIDSSELPVLALVKHNALIDHWLVLLDSSGSTATLADPLREAESAGSGRRRLSRAEFEACYRGLLVTIEDRDGTNPVRVPTGPSG